MLTLNEAELFQGSAALIAAWRLASLGLARSQTAILSFLCLSSLCCFLLSTLPAASDYYFWIFLVCTGCTWAVSAWSVREMFSLSMAHYPGIRSAARWVLYASIAFSFLFSAGLAVSGWLKGPHGQTSLYYIQGADRVVVLTLAAIVAGLLWFLSRYPLHLSRNTYTSCILFSLVFVSEGVADLIDSFAPWLYWVGVDTAEVLLGAILFLGWAFLLRQETFAPARRVTFDDPRETDLLRQLDAMNRLLSRVGRR